MTTGFTQRWKGKITAASLWVAGQQQNGIESPSTDSTLGAVRTSRLTPSSGAGVYTVPAPGLYGIGLERNILIPSVSSGAKLKAAAGSNFGVIGTSTMIVLASTVPMSLSLLAVSSVQWQLKGVWSTSTTVIPQPTFSTTT